MLSDSPPERDLQWSETGVTASFKFINKLYELVDRFKNYQLSESDDLEIKENLKSIINQVTENIESFQFNKSVAKIYEFVNILNEAISKKRLSHNNFEWSLKKLCLILQPFVPHISEEMWSCVGGGSLCISENWPFEKTKKETTAKIAIQINGKTKEIIVVDQNLSKEEIFDIVKSSDKIKKHLLGKSISREIYVPGKIVNLVIE